MQAEEIRRELIVTAVYLQLMTSIDPTESGINNPQVHAALKEALAFVDEANPAEMQRRGRSALALLQPVRATYAELAAPKIPIEQIAADFSVLCRDDKALYSNGLELHWLWKRMHIEDLGFAPDPPLHARVGLGVHAGFSSVEEEFLLRDAFYMLALAEHAADALDALSESWRQRETPIDRREAHRTATPINQNVASCSRLAIVSFHSFVESFVNSVAHDTLLRSSQDLPTEQVHILKGLRRDRLASLEYKIEKIPSVIRSDGRAPIRATDSTQLPEQLRFFLEETKPLRDSAMHFAPSKAPIWRKPAEWLQLAKKSAAASLELATMFWKACYPDRDGPQYLTELEYSVQWELAVARRSATVSHQDNADRGSSSG